MQFQSTIKAYLIYSIKKQMKKQLKILNCLQKEKTSELYGRLDEILINKLLEV